MTRARSNAGFTLVEMLVAMVIGLTLSLIAFGLVDFTMRRTGEIAARVEIVQRGRSTMDTMTRELRSQVCVLRDGDATMTDPRSIYLANAAAVSFFADLSDESVRTGSVVTPPQLRSLSFEGNSLVERVWPGTSTGTVALPKYTYPATATSTRTLLTPIALYVPPAPAAQVAVPGFTYYAFDTALSPPTATKPLIPVGTASLTSDQMEQIARVQITYRALPAGGTAQRGTTVFQDDVYARTIDPNIATLTPTCT